MTSSIMHSCDESDDSLRITSVEVEVEADRKFLRNPNLNEISCGCAYINYNCIYEQVRSSKLSNL